MNKIAIAGAGGRMGQALITLVHAAPDCELTGALERENAPHLGEDATRFMGSLSGIVVHSDLRKGLENAQVLIDFTRPEGTMEHLSICRELGVKMVIGTTGFSEAQKALIQAASQDIAIVMSPNMSVGVNVTLKLLAMAAQAFAEDYDIEVIEAHHRHKVDAPSGTALKMGEVIAAAIGRDLKADGVFQRVGHTGERLPREIGFSTIRGGDIVGDHTVLFAGMGERIEITHKASSRDTFAAGSLRAARFLSRKNAGMYDMFAVLGLDA